MTGRLLDRPWQTWGVGLGGVLAWDTWLVTTGRESMSEGAGRHRIVSGCLLGYLSVHLLSPKCLRRFSRIDPLSVACRRLQRSTP